MEDYLKDAEQELKRVDHLIFVSLKYTRTVDVIRSVISRLESALDNMAISILEYEKHNKRITGYPKSTGQRIEFLRSIYNDNSQVIEFLNFHSLLRKVMRTKYTKREEYRRHVTMTVVLDTNEEIDISIDTLLIYYENSKKFLQIISQIVQERND